MIKKSLLIGLLAALFIPAYVSAAAELIAPKPIVAIVCDVIFRSDLVDGNLPYQDFTNLVTRLLPNFDVRTLSLFDVAGQNLRWNLMNYVLIAAFTNSEYRIDELERSINKAGLNDAENMAYVLLKGQEESNAIEQFIKSFQISFPDAFTLNWRSSAGEAVFQVFQPNEDFTNFTNFLKRLNNTVQKKHAR